MTASSSHRRPLRKVMVASLVGSSLEWYDFFLYATASALVLNKVFFPGSDPTAGTLLSLATFGVGFVVRPVGAALFGVIGDRFGRKPSLVITLILMGLATALIGLLPGYASIGLWAPVSLVVLRLLQGLGAGAEHGGATIFAAEHSPPSKRGFFGSIAASGMYVGVLLSSGIFALFALLPHDAFLSWGWRAPFLISVGLVAVGLYIRLGIDETPQFRESNETEAAGSPLIVVFRDQWRSVLTVIGIVAAPFTATYVYQTYSLTYLQRYHEPAGSIGTVSLTAASVVAIVMVPVAGRLSDRVGRRPVIVVGAVFSALFAFPFFWLLDAGSPAAVPVAMVGGVGIGVPLMLGPQGALLAELFGARSRFTGFALSRELGSLLFAGMTPLIAAVLVTEAGGHSWPVSCYVVGACLITLATGLLVSDIKPVAATPVGPSPADAAQPRH
ncbi:MAG TPA: MFS transporter [Amycolatopsis sp.]|jgi:MHS family shikimate/dehydroshikimate transporter-like MFS transporter|nr:MFS transporter [Amycolatopsis sp.]